MTHSVYQTILDFLNKCGHTEIRFLCRTIKRIGPFKKSEHDLLEYILRLAQKIDSGVCVVEYPSYRLKRFSKSLVLPSGKYAKVAIRALRAKNGPMNLHEITEEYDAKYNHHAQCPEFWMWTVLGSKEMCHFISISGKLCVGLTEKHQRTDTDLRSSPVLNPNSILANLTEKELEEFLVSKLSLIESGLTLYKEQYRTEVGIVDLLCVDREKNYVVVELKRPAISDRRVVGQITTYMGWIKKNMATENQKVRGIIVVGQKDERLTYAVDSIPDISVKTCC